MIATRKPWRVMAARFTVLALAAVATGCTVENLLIVDPVFEAIFPSTDDYLPSGSRVTVRTGLDPSASLADQAVNIIAQSNARDVTILTPLFFDQAAAIANRFPEKQFGVMAGSSRTVDNLVSLRFDRVAAFRAAGEAAQDFLAAGDRSLVLFARLRSEEQQREITAFEGRIDSQLVSQRFVYSGVPERETIRRQALSVGEEEVLLAVFLGPDSVFALELLAPRGDVVITEDLGPATPFPDVVLGSVERPYDQAVAAILTAVTDPAAEVRAITVAAEFRRRMSPPDSQNQLQ